MLQISVKFMILFSFVFHHWEKLILLFVKTVSLCASVQGSLVVVKIKSTTSLFHQVRNMQNYAIECTKLKVCVSVFDLVSWCRGQTTVGVYKHIPVLERVRTRTQWVSPSPDSSPDLDSTLVDLNSDSDSTSVDSDSIAVDSDSGVMDSDSDSTQVDLDSQWVQVSPVRNIGLQGKNLHVQ